MPSDSALLSGSLSVLTEPVLFFKTQQPVDPVSVVHQICEDALSSPSPKKSRFIQRLTPVSLMGRASEVGLEELATKVLAPHFHLKDGVTKKVCNATGALEDAIGSNNQIIAQGGGGAC